MNEDDYDNQFADSTYVPPHEQEFEYDSEEAYDSGGITMFWINKKWICR